MRLRAWLRASHLAPTVTMTVVITGLCAAAGWPAGRLVLCALAALFGQLSIGWSNDAHDANLDHEVGRATKPVVQGLISEHMLRRAAFVMLLLSIVFSILAGGLLAGSFHVVAVLSAWLYNFQLSRTSWSWLPYAISFACLAPFATLGSTDPHWPALWLPVALSLIGIGSHAANALPDLERDRGAGVGGLATKLGRQQTTVVALVSFIGASMLLALMIRGWAGIGVLAIAGLLTVLTALGRTDSLVFRLMLAAGLIDLAFISFSGVLSSVS